MACSSEICVFALHNLFCRCLIWYPNIVHENNIIKYKIMILTQVNAILLDALFLYGSRRKVEMSMYFMAKS